MSQLELKQFSKQLHKEPRVLNVAVLLINEAVARDVDKTKSGEVRQ